MKTEKITEDQFNTLLKLVDEISQYREEFTYKDKCDLINDVEAFILDRCALEVSNDSESLDEEDISDRDLNDPEKGT